ncbi:MAG: S-layer homology domain-containing protein, partial [Eubacteriales bacterium]|nr:S-layer homology domain-containing protein [Eubacteriales bacterium]
MKRTTACLLSILLIMSAAYTVYGMEYSDIMASNWAYEAVNTMSDKGIIKGYPDGSFRPENTVTYGEFIKMSLIADTGKDVGNSADGYWADSYYEAAVRNKYFTKYDIPKANLSKEIDRAHMALIMSAILGDVDIKNYDKIQEGITDISYKTQYEYDITKAYAAGILTGYTDNTFKPERTLSRAESATVIHRLVDESKRVLPDAGGVESEPKPLDEVITNLDSFYTQSGNVEKFLSAAETYEFDTDSAKYQMTLGENRGTKWIHFPA